MDKKIENIKTELRELFYKKLDLDKEIEFLEKAYYAKVSERRYNNQIRCYLEKELDKFKGDTNAYKCKQRHDG